MKTRILAGLAAGGLLISQSAAAATRAGADVGPSESLAGESSAAVPATALILLMAVIFGIMALTDGDDDGFFPASP